jgi:hypothetical protein
VLNRRLALRAAQRNLIDDDEGGWRVRHPGLHDLARRVSKVGFVRQLLGVLFVLSFLYTTISDASKLVLYCFNNVCVSSSVPKYVVFTASPFLSVTTMV